jgi:hypothetical protein
VNAHCAMPARRMSARRGPGQTRARAIPVAQPVFPSPLIVQRKCACGGGCQSCKEEKFEASHGLQTKLTVNAPGDAAENEADRIAEQVTSMNDGGDVTQDHGASDSQRNQRPKEITRKGGPGGRNFLGTTAPPIVHDALQQPGQPLDLHSRAFFESRFNQDFSNVQVHTGELADRSARAVDARAYSVGTNIVFAQGEYAPSAATGKQLIAHELVHVVQQTGRTSTPVLFRKPEDCPPDRVEEPSHPGDCPEITPDKKELRETAKAVSAVETGVAGECYLLTNLSTGSIKFGSPKEFDAIADFLELDPSLLLHITGFSDCTGTADENASLRMKRAYAVEDYFIGVLNVDPKRLVVEPTAPTDYIATNSSREGRNRNHSVALYLGAPKTSHCPPLSNAPVDNLDEYIDLVRCAERISGYAPPRMLAMLRQLYYGKSWSATSTTELWDKVIPCSPDIGNPKSMLGDKLYEALRNSATLQGQDLGHVFTGLEAMMCPGSSVTVSKLLPVGTVNMENEAFATWGGDVAAAAAAMVACWDMENSERSNSMDCGNEKQPKGLPFYFIQIQAPPEDLEGDINAFLIRAAEMGIPCTGSTMKAFSPSRPVSEMFSEYYHNAGASGKKHEDRYRCFVEAIGGKISGNKIDNRKDLIPKYRKAIESFAEAYYLKIMKEPRGFGGPGTEARILAHGGSVTRLQLHAVNALNLFFNWIESHL